MVAGSHTIVVGAGEAGSMLLRESGSSLGFDCRIIGLVDDDPAKQGMKLHGVPVLGTLAELPQLVKSHRVQSVIIAIPSEGHAMLRRITERCAPLGIRVMTLPSLTEILDKGTPISQVRNVECNDLLGRDPVILDESAIVGYLSGRRVLVTGGAGSIGSELCRQVARFAPAQLIIMDHAETPLFHIDREMRAAWPELVVIPVLGDVKNADKVETIFAAHRPDVVFHAAAYKHVPLMEFNPAEAVMNNISGTKIVADAAHRYDSADFVMISTDKAVNPANVMGASKRAAEIYIQALSGTSHTRFTTVRFGNVLGSNGSVIPLFMEQIRNGGPVTVTDPEITRYFMTIPEAAQLVLQAGCLGTGGEIFVLDMGEPVRIADLAEQLVRLSGLVPGEDIQIVYTGLRPGEKLYEELLADHEGVTPTSHGKIMVAKASRMDLDAVNGELRRLFDLTARFNISGIVQNLRRLVPEFTPGAMHEESSYDTEPATPVADSRTDRPGAKILQLRPRHSHPHQPGKDVLP